MAEVAVCFTPFLYLYRRQYEPQGSGEAACGANEIEQDLR